MRLFVSLPLPDHVQDHLALAVRSVTDLDPAPAPGRPALRWVPPEQRHITVAFYGEVPAGAVEELTEDLAAVAAAVPPLRLRLHGAGVFSGRTMWVGVQEDDGGAALVALMAACEDVGSRYTDLERRDRRRAHVTLARVRDRRAGADELTRRARALSVYAGPTWTAVSLRLVVSELGAGKGGTPVHEPLAELTLT